MTSELHFVGFQRPEGLRVGVLESARTKLLSSAVGGAGRLALIEPPDNPDLRGLSAETEAAVAILAYLLQSQCDRVTGYESDRERERAVRRAAERAFMFRIEVIDRLPAHGWVLPARAVWGWLRHDLSGQDVLDQVTALGGRQEPGSAIAAIREEAYTRRTRRTWR